MYRKQFLKNAFMMRTDNKNIEFNIGTNQFILNILNKIHITSNNGSSIIGVNWQWN